MKVMMIATSSITRGGITSVINSYKSNKIWSEYNIIWLETHVDKNFILTQRFFIAPK